MNTLSISMVLRLHDGKTIFQGRKEKSLEVGKDSFSWGRSDNVRKRALVSKKWMPVNGLTTRFQR